MYAISAETQGVEARSLPLNSDLGPLFAHQAIPKLIFLCNPNNPTGDLLKRPALMELLEQTAEHSLVVLDEAYIEFSIEDQATDLMAAYPNLVIMRTLSKAFGLAGIRCGFSLASPEIISILQKVSAPYPIPQPSLEIALDALSQKGIDRMRTDVADLTRQRTRLVKAITGATWVRQVYPSAANFLLVQVRDALQLKSQLQDQGILVRDQSWQPGLDNVLRFSIGTESEMERLITALNDFQEVK
jgi:histidinol-phosphate aminotransferase